MTSSSVRPRLAHTRAGRGRPTRPYGLTQRELRAEILRCINNGWAGWEIRYRFFSKDHSE